MFLNTAYGYGLSHIGPPCTSPFGVHAIHWAVQVDDISKCRIPSVGRLIPMSVASTKFKREDRHSISYKPHCWVSSRTGSNHSTFFNPCGRQVARNQVQRQQILPDSGPYTPERQYLHQRSEANSVGQIVGDCEMLVWVKNNARKLLDIAANT